MLFKVTLMKNILIILFGYLIIISCSEDQVTNSEEKISIGGHWIGKTVESNYIESISMVLYQDGNIVKTMERVRVKFLIRDEDQWMYITEWYIIEGEYYYPKVELSFKDFNGHLVGSDSICGNINTGDSLIFVRQYLEENN